MLVITAYLLKRPQLFWAMSSAASLCLRRPRNNAADIVTLGPIHADTGRECHAERGRQHCLPSHSSPSPGPAFQSADSIYAKSLLLNRPALPSALAPTRIHETAGGFAMKNIGPVPERSYRKCSFLLGLAVFTFGFSLSVNGESDPNACRGIDFDAKRPLVASRITTRPHVNFVKGSDEDRRLSGGQRSLSQEGVSRSR